MDITVPALIALILTAIGWLSREIWRWRKAKRLAAEDATKTLHQKKALIEDIISKTEDDNTKQTLLPQLEEVNAALLGLYGQRLRHTLKEAGLPTEELLIADGRTLLKPQEATLLKESVEELKSLPSFLSLQDLLVLGSAYYYMEQYQDAKNIYDRILNLNPNDPATLYNRGVTYAKLERYDEALADYNRSLELRPDDPATLNNRGTTYTKLGRDDKALADFNRSLELRPDDPDTLFNRGTTYDKLKRYDEALADYNRSLELRPDDPATLNNRGNTYARLERYDEALADYNHSLELRPDDPRTLYNRGVTYAMLERYNEAIADFNRSLELKPDDPDTLYNLACLFSLQRGIDDALAYLERAIEKDENCREMAKTDEDFNNIRDDPRFKKLVEPD